MESNEKIKMIGYTPNLAEQEKINFIAEVYHLKSTSVIRNLMYNKVTLTEFYEAKRYATKRLDDEIDMAEMVSDGMVIL